MRRFGAGEVEGGSISVGEGSEGCGAGPGVLAVDDAMESQLLLQLVGLFRPQVLRQENSATFLVATGRVSAW